MADGQSIIQLIGERQNTRQFRKKNWSGKFEEYLDLIRESPEITRTAYERLYDMILSYGTKTYEDGRDKRVRYTFFDDPDGSADMVIAEKLEAAFLEQLGQMIASPESPLQPRHVAKIMRLIRDKDMDLIDAFEKVTKEAQEEQSQEVPADDPAAVAPGLDGPGAIPPPVAGPSQGTDNVADLFGRLRMPSMQVNTPTGGRA